jgi:Putative auto-transporter adhesin, head GIN domain
MKKLFLASIALLMSLPGFSQGDKNLQSRQVSEFHGVEVSGGIDLYLSSGPQSVSVAAATNEIRDHIKTEVVDGILRIHLENNWYHGWGNPKMRAYVSIADPRLQKLESSGGGDIYLQNQIAAGDLTVGLSGGSDLKGKINANHLIINQSGGSDIDISGTVQSLDVKASGGSDLAGYGLVTDYVTLNTSGGSDVRLTVNKELRVMASGGSEVSYKGTASVKEIKTSGSGSVTHKD